MIQPTVGCIVYYCPSVETRWHKFAPLAAIITHVWSDTCVNLVMFDPNGNPFSSTSVLLVQPDSERPTAGHFCEWMPYQVKKTTGSESGEKAAGQEAI